jgi:hypothetical protein
VVRKRCLAVAVFRDRYRGRGPPGLRRAAAGVAGDRLRVGGMTAMTRSTGRGNPRQGACGALRTRFALGRQRKTCLVFATGGCRRACRSGRDRQREDGLLEQQAQREQDGVGVDGGAGEHRSAPGKGIGRAWSWPASAPADVPRTPRLPCSAPQNRGPVCETPHTGDPRSARKPLRSSDSRPARRLEPVRVPWRREPRCVNLRPAMARPATLGVALRLDGSIEALV